MDYGSLLRRAWHIVWGHKYLLVLGMLAALGSGGTPSSGSSYQVSSDEVEGAVGQMPSFRQFEPWMGLVIVAAVAIILLLIVAGLVLWGIAQVAHGGLIAGVDQIEGGAESSFTTAWRTGWQRVWTLLGIGLLPLIPVCCWSPPGWPSGSCSSG
jgi:hypothetical protein